MPFRCKTTFHNSIAKTYRILNNHQQLTQLRNHATQDPGFILILFLSFQEDYTEKIFLYFLRAIFLYSKLQVLWINAKQKQYNYFSAAICYQRRPYHDDRQSFSFRRVHVDNSFFLSNFFSSKNINRSLFKFYHWLSSAQHAYAVFGFEYKFLFMFIGIEPRIEGKSSKRKMHQLLDSTNDNIHKL